MKRIFTALLVAIAAVFLSGATPYREVSGLTFGMKCDGATNDSAALQKAIDFFVSGSGTVELPNGNCKLVTGVTIAQDRIHIVGKGPYATTLTFAPAANGTALKFSKSGATVLYQGSVRNLTIRSDDTTYVKTAIELVDTSGYIVENIVIGGSQVVGSSGYWGDTTFASKGIYSRGREAASFRNIYDYANKPLVIGPNPNSSISIDHYNFHNMYLSAAQNPIVTIESGVTLTQASFTGYQVWVGGYGGLSWVDATAPGSSNGLLLENVRYEQTTDATKYFVQIDVTSPMQGLMVRGGQTGGGRGFYLRKVREATIDTFFYSDTTREAMNVTATNLEEINLVNDFWQTGSTATLTGVAVSHQEPSQTSMPLPKTGRLVPAASGSYDEIVENTIASKEITLAVNAKYVIGGAAQTGLVMVTTRNDWTALYALKGGTAGTVSISDWAGGFNATLGNATTINIAWDGGLGKYVVENKTAASVQLRVLRMGRAQ